MAPFLWGRKGRSSHLLPLVPLWLLLAHFLVKSLGQGVEIAVHVSVHLARHGIHPAAFSASSASSRSCAAGRSSTAPGTPAAPSAAAAPAAHGIVAIPGVRAECQKVVLRSTTPTSRLVHGPGIGEEGPLPQGRRRLGGRRRGGPVSEGPHHKLVGGAGEQLIRRSEGGDLGARRDVPGDDCFTRRLVLRSVEGRGVGGRRALEDEALHDVRTKTQRKFTYEGIIVFGAVGLVGVGPAEEQPRASMPGNDGFGGQLSRRVERNLSEGQLGLSWDSRAATDSNYFLFSGDIYLSEI